jgi:hypothetical protein
MTCPPKSTVTAFVPPLPDRNIGPSLVQWTRSLEDCIWNFQPIIMEPREQGRHNWFSSLAKIMGLSLYYLWLFFSAVQRLALSGPPSLHTCFTEAGGCFPVPTVSIVVRQLWH